MTTRPDPECIVRDPNTKRNCPYSLYCAVCDLDDDPGLKPTDVGGRVDER